MKKICLLVADNGGAPVMELKRVTAKSFLECLAGLRLKAAAWFVRLGHLGNDGRL